MSDDYANIWELIAARGEATIPHLITALKDGNSVVRERAATALGDIAEKGVDCSAAVPALIDTLKDGNSFVRGSAAFALQSIAEKTEIDLNLVGAALIEYVDSVRRNGNPTETLQAEREAARQLIRITNAAARFRASLQTGMKGLLLEAELPRPPRDKMYRTAARRAFA